MKKKSISLLLSSVMIASMFFTGCGNQGQNAISSETQNVSGSETSSVSATTESVEPLEKVSVVIAGGRADNYPKMEDMTFIQQLEDNVSDYLEIEWLDWSSTTSDEKRNLAINSGNYPDAMLGSWILNTAETANYAGQEILVPLEDYITEELTPNLHALFEARPEYKEQLTAPDGHIYALPHYDESASLLRTINETMMINTEWLKAVGKEMPTTTEELYDVLVAFRDAGDLNGNGAADEIPMTFFYGGNALGMHMKGPHSLLGWFGVTGNKTGLTQLENGDVVFAGIQPEFKEAVQYLHKLYSENLLDKEIFTMADSAYTAKCQAPEPMVGVLVWWSKAAIDAKAGEGVYEYLPPLSSPNGKDPVWAYRDSPIYDNLAFWVTDKGADKLPQLMMFIDQFYDPEVGAQLAYGTEGKFIEKVSDNVYRILKDAEGNDYKVEQKAAEVPLEYAPYLILAENFQLETQTTSNIANMQAQAVYKDYIEPAYVYLNPWLTGEEAQEEGILAADIQDHYRTHFARWVVEGGVEEEWDSYVAGYEKLNLDRWMEIKLKDEYEK